MVKITILENFKTLPSARQYLAQKNCWRSCIDCKKLWDNTKTTHVHTKVFNVGGVVTTRFICDSCLAEMKQADRANVEFMKMPK